MYAEVTFSDGAWKQEIGKGKKLLKEIKVSQQQQEEDTFALFWTQLEEHLSFSENVGNLLTVSTDQLPCIYIYIYVSYFFCSF